MKKIYSIIAMAMLAFSSHAAITVTYDGQPLSNGQQVNLGKDSFTHTYIPGVLSKFKAEAELSVTGTAPIQLKAQGQDQVFQFCTSENCFSLSDIDGDGVFNGEATIKTSPENIQVDVNIDGETLPADLKSVISFTLTDASGSSISFKVGVDTSTNAGVANVSGAAGYVRANGAALVYSVNAPTAVAIYSIAGNNVFNATINGDGELKFDALRPGLYLFRAGRHTGKILVK